MPINADIFNDDLNANEPRKHDDDVVVPLEAATITPPPRGTEAFHDVGAAPQTEEVEKVPFTGWRSKAGSSNGIMAIAGGILIAAVAVFLLTSNRKKPANPNGTAQPAAATTTAPPPRPQNTPSNDVNSTGPITAPDQTTPAEILGTKTGTSQIGNAPGDTAGTHTIQVGDHASSNGTYSGNSAALANVGSFPGGSGHYQVPPPGSNTNAESGGYLPTSGGPAPKPSLVFTRKGTEFDKVNSASSFPQIHASNFGLPIGYKVAVRLESVATTALKSPVIAVVEYNVVKDGQIIIPAGATFIGTISEADRNGTMGFQFTRLMQHDGTGTNIAAIAVDKNLAALKGDVIGKNTGKKIIVGLAQGLGTVGAVAVGGGTGSLSAPYSEGDAIRQQVAQNAGNTGNNAIQTLSQTERIIVALPAGTEFYAEFVDTVKTNP